MGHCKIPPSLFRSLNKISRATFADLYNNRHVVIRGRHGFLHCDVNNRLRPHSGRPDEYCRWRVVSVQEGRFALQSHTGRYLSLGRNHATLQADIRGDERQEFVFQNNNQMHGIRNAVAVQPHRFLSIGDSIVVRPTHDTDEQVAIFIVA